MRLQEAWQPHHEEPVSYLVLERGIYAAEDDHKQQNAPEKCVLHAGTEMERSPHAGPNRRPMQSQMNAGQDEHEVCAEIMELVDMGDPVHMGQRVWQDEEPA